MIYLEKLLDTEPGLAMRFYCKLAQTLTELLLSTNPSDPNKKVLETPPVDRVIKEYKDKESKSEASAMVDKFLETKFGLKDEVVIKGNSQINASI